MVVLAALVMSATGPDAARASSATLASGLRADPVFVVRGAAPTLSVAERGRLRLQILRKDIGRIRFAVVPESEATGSGGIASLTNAIDHRLRGRGSTVVVAGRSVYVVVSYPAAQSAAAVLRRAFATRPGSSLAYHLQRAVDGLARLDPGPSGDIDHARQGSAPGTPPAISLEPFKKPLDLVSTAKDTFQVVAYVIAGAIGLPFLILAGWLLLRLRRRREEEGAALKSGRAQAEEQLMAIGDDIRALDIDVSMPGADAAGVASYGQALESYERAERALEQGDSPAELRMANGILAAARRQMDVAKEKLGRTPASPAPSGAPDTSSDTANRALGRP
jgi:hypothetical protein